MNKNIDIKNIKTAKRYACALSQSASDCIDEVKCDLEAIDEAIFKNNELRTFFLHPVVSLKDKKDVIYQTLEGKINPKTFNFLLTLLDENRLNIFNTVFELFKMQLDKIKNKQTVQVISAIELDEEQKQNLKAKLTQKLNKEVVLDMQKDESILAGLVIKFEDKVLDLSLKAQFAALKNN